MGNKMSINIFDYLINLEQERNRVIILHTPPDKGPELTQFCKKICTKLDAKYLDLLEFFIQSEELREKIDTFSPEKMKGLLIEQSIKQSLVVVDRVDFLLDTWRSSERQDFYRMVREQWDGFKEGMRSKLIICLQTSHEILSLNIKDSQDQTRIFQLSDFHEIL